MEKFKICPNCGTKNETDAIECENCEWDLISVAISSEQEEKKSAEKVSSSENQSVKICDCGAKNPSNARKCSSCGEDISDIMPTVGNLQNNYAPITERPPTNFFLRSSDGKINFKIDKEKIIFGRENELQNYLAEKTFVSRKHCRITLEDGEIFVEDLNSANSTYVNNKKISRKTKLSRGDEISLGGNVLNGERQDKAAYFLVN